MNDYLARFQHNRIYCYIGNCYDHATVITLVKASNDHEFYIALCDECKWHRRVIFQLDKD